MSKTVTPHELAQLKDLQHRHDTAFARLGMVTRDYENAKKQLLQDIAMLEAGRQTLGERILSAYGIDPKDPKAQHQINHDTGEIQVFRNGQYVSIDDDKPTIIRPNGGGLAKPT